MNKKIVSYDIEVFKLPKQLTESIQGRKIMARYDNGSCQEIFTLDMVPSEHYKAIEDLCKTLEENRNLFSKLNLSVRT